MSRWEDKAQALWDAWVRVTGAAPLNLNALYLGLAQAEFETQCGDAWPSSHNWGACDLRSLNADELAAFHAGQLHDGDWLYPDGSFRSAHDDTAIGQLHGDSDPNTGGFQVWFAAFPDDVAGAAYFLGIALRSTRAVLHDPACSPWSYAASLYMGCYYGGFHAGARPCGKRSTPLNAAENANIADYANALTARLHVLVPALASWKPLGTVPGPAPSPPPGEAVKALQVALNDLGAHPPLVVDGVLGPLTRAACEAEAKG